jgi:outer membrane protein OmpA-like peptidoglycan-associated protein
MKKTYLTLACAAALGACAHNTPQQLVDARSEYERVKNGPATQVAPAQLHEAKVALDHANQSFADDGDSPSTVDLAYVAQRKAEWAETEARIALNAQQKGQAEKDQLSTAVSNGKMSREELARAQQANALNQQQLQSNQQQLAQSADQLQQEKDARALAEQNAADAQAKLAQLAQVKEDERGKIITLNGSVLFTSGQSDLLDSARDRLKQVADALKTMGNHDITVEGFTDSRGSESLNQRLSERRAQAVRDYLAGQGVTPDKIKSEGMGKANPIADNKTAEGRAMNRRVEIVIARDKT